MLIKFFSALNVNKIVMPRNYSSDRHYKCIDPFKDTKHKHTKPVRGKTVCALGPSVIIEKSDPKFSFKRETIMCSNCKKRLRKLIYVQGTLKWPLDVSSLDDEREHPSSSTVIDQASSSTDEPKKDYSESDPPSDVESANNSDGNDTEGSLEFGGVEDFNETLELHNIST